MASSAPASISQIAALLNQGSYGQAFQLAQSSGNLGLLEHPETLYQIAPNAFTTQAQFDSFYSAFAPYLSQAAGQSSGGQGQSYGDVTAWNGQANLANSANTDYADSIRAQQALPRDQALVAATANNPYASAPGGISFMGTSAFDPKGTLQQDEAQAAPDLARYLSRDLSYEAQNKANNVGLASFALTAASAGIGALGGAAGLAAAEGVSTPLAGAEIGAGLGAAGSAISGGNPLVGALTGGLGGYSGAGGFSGAGTQIGTALGATGQTATGLGNTLIGAGTGALTGELTGQGAGAGALTGGLSAGLTAAGVPKPFASLGGKLAGSEIGSATATSGTHPISVLSSQSPGGQPVDTLDPITSMTSPITSGNVPADPTATGGGSSLLGNLGTGLLSGLGLDPNNIAGSVGSTLGGLGPYAAIGALGLQQANAGRQNDQNYVKQAAALGQPFINQANQGLSQYNAGTLSPTDQKVVDTSQQQGQSIIDAANPLSQIAQKAFNQYASGQLSAADQLTLNNQVAAQKAQVRSQLQSQGITDSTILTAQDQQIDNQALITKQNLLQQQFSLGNQAYDSWLQSTTQGQQTILAGQKFASTELQQTLLNSFQAAGIGDAAIMSSIQMAMQTDAQYAEQVSQLMGTLASAYAYQQAKKAGIGGAANGSALPGSVSSGGSSVPSPPGGGSVPDLGNLGQYLDSTQAGFDNQLSDSMTSDLSKLFDSQDIPQLPAIEPSGDALIGDITTTQWGP